MVSKSWPETASVGPASASPSPIRKDMTPEPTPSKVMEDS